MRSLLNPVVGASDVPGYVPRATSLGGLPVVASRSGSYGNGTVSNGTDTSQTSRFAHIVRVAAADLRLVYGNHIGAADGLNAITVKASVEPPVAAKAADGSVVATFPVTFDGQPSVTIQPGAVAVSDPIPVVVAPDQWLYTRTYVSVGSAGQKWPTGSYLNSGLPSSNEGFAVGTDYTAATPPTNNLAAGSGPAYGPYAILGIPTTGQPVRTVGILGDSIDYGSGETFQDLGFNVRALNAQGLGYINLAKPGERGDQAWATTGVVYRQRMAFAANVTDVLEGYGRNDISQGLSLAQVQAARLDFWKALAARRIRVRARTVTPRTTSSDGWTSLVGQTVTTTSGQETTRVAFNTWLRDGAPLDASGAPVVAGSTAAGVLRTGRPGHPLAGWWDAAAAVESSLNSGLWAAPERVVNDAAISSGSLTVTSATAAFTSADVGKSAYLAGAGSAGAAIVITIASVTNATTAVLAGAPVATTVSGAKLAIGQVVSDGVHPATSGHMMIATQVPRL